MGVPDPPGEGEIWGPTPSQNMQLQIASKAPVPCCHLTDTNEELSEHAIAIPPLAKLFWSLLVYLFDNYIRLCIKLIVIFVLSSAFSCSMFWMKIHDHRLLLKQILLHFARRREAKAAVC